MVLLFLCRLDLRDASIYTKRNVSSLRLDPHLCVLTPGQDITQRRIIAIYYATRQIAIFKSFRK